MNHIFLEILWAARPHRCVWKSRTDYWEYRWRNISHCDSYTSALGEISSLLPNLIITVRHCMRADNFDSDEERRLYLEYNVTTKVIIKFVIAMGMAGTIAYHVRPLIFRMLASKFLVQYLIFLQNFTKCQSGNFSSLGANGKTNITYVLPYRVNLFFDYQNPGFYYFVFLLQSITIFIHLFVTATIAHWLIYCKI